MSTVFQNLIQKAVGDGARSTKFEINIYMPQPFYSNQQDISVLAKSSNFPGKNHEIVDIKYKGRSIPVKGQVKYTQTWDCTFYLTEDHSLKLAFENWIDYLDQEHSYKTSGPIFEGDNYSGKLEINQLDFELKKDTINYNIYNAFPIAISQVDTDYTAIGNILEFTVTFAYSHFESFTQESKSNYIESALNDGKQKIQNEVNNIKTKISNSIMSNSLKIYNKVSDAAEELKNMKGWVD